jgi:NADH-ubiquinone oxidoreductase chain 3
MKSIIFFLFFVPILAAILLGVNFLLASHNPYQEKNSVFECGFHSFTGQNRTQFSISFFVFGLLFLLFDLEILLVYPYSVSSYTNDIYGLYILMVFFILLTLGFIFELGKNALTIDSRQIFELKKKEVSNVEVYLVDILTSSVIDFNINKNTSIEREEKKQIFVENFVNFLVHSKSIDTSADAFMADLMDRTVVREREGLWEFIILPSIGSFDKTEKWIGLKVYYKLDPLSLHKKSFMPVEKAVFLDKYTEKDFTKIKSLVSTFLADSNLINESDLPMLQDFSNIIVSEFETGFSICIKIKISIDSVAVIKICTDDVIDYINIRECQCNQFTAISSKQDPLSDILK